MPYKVNLSLLIGRRVQLPEIHHELTPQKGRHDYSWLSWRCGASQSDQCSNVSVKVARDSGRNRGPRRRTGMVSVLIRAAPKRLREPMGAKRKRPGVNRAFRYKSPMLKKCRHCVGLWRQWVMVYFKGDRGDANDCRNLSQNHRSFMACDFDRM